MEPAELIKALRRRHGLSQADLASQAGTSQPVISAYENGRRDPTFHTLQKIVAAAGERLQIDAVPAEPGLEQAVGVGEHGRRLLEVLSLADAIPARRRSATLQAPRLVSR